MLVEAVEINLGDKHILPQFAGRGHVWMNLAELGDSSAIQHGASRASGMIVVSRLRIVVERPMAEGGEQAFDVALQVEERQRTRRRAWSQSADYLRIHVPRRTHRDALQLQRFFHQL